MLYLVAAVVFVGLLCLLDLVLTVGLVRRLRQHTELLNERSNRQGSHAGEVMTAVGTAPQEFTATTIDGEAITRDSLTTSTLVGFIAPGCKPCRAEFPHFLRAAAEHPGGREHVLAVVSDGPGSAEYAAQLKEVARVVVEAPDGVVTTAFSVRGVPAFGLLGAGTAVTAAAVHFADLPAAVPA
ncbi:TlpA family protein disulfide reductase [Streptomyces echinatus]|uniref:TlpA family protein disulfide reductase n=1 Tax=Streptomyces echinatus TaxID=67293 RepID=UPI0038058D02